MPERHIIVVAIDGLRASALGAYGNTSFPTPALDQLAAESFLFDACFAPTVNLAGIRRALWQSVHPRRTTGYAAPLTPLPTLLAEDGYRATLVTDEPDLAAAAGKAGFEQCDQVGGSTEQRADNISQTALARLFSAACAVVESAHDAPQLVWVHARGMYGAWDAPLELQQLMLDEDDPPQLEYLSPPDIVLSDYDDPDTTFRFGVAYAAQVMVLDACWQALDEALETSGSSDWLVMLLGARGLPLGEHQRIGGIDPRLYVEQLHVPWLIRFADRAGRLARSSQLVSQLDLAPTILDLAGDLARGDRSSRDGQSVMRLVEPQAVAWRDALVFGDATGRRGIRTPAWSLLYDPERGADSGELFVRPDDRWEANNVATLCPEVADGLTAASDTISARLGEGDPMPSDRLAEELRTPVS